MIKADTPFALMLEMHAVVLGVPALILLASAAIVALIRPGAFLIGRLGLQTGFRSWHHGCGSCARTGSISSRLWHAVRGSTLSFSLRL